MDRPLLVARTDMRRTAARQISRKDIGTATNRSKEWLQNALVQARLRILITTDKIIFFLAVNLSFK
jgi:hypothetical protein